MITEIVLGNLIQRPQWEWVTLVINGQVWYFHFGPFLSHFSLTYQKLSKSANNSTIFYHSCTISIIPSCSRTVNIVCYHSITFNLICTQKYHSFLFAFVFNENEQDISFITTDYCSISLTTFIFYRNGIIWWNWMRLNCNKISLKTHPVLLNGTEMATKINLAHAWYCCLFTKVINTFQATYL